MSRAAFLASLLVCFAWEIFAQAPPPKKPPVVRSNLCARTNAIENTRQQILFARTFDQAVPRIAVLLRAADLLWPHDAERSMATFMEAYDVAVENYKEQGDQLRRASTSQFSAVIAVPDQRFKVLAALAKRDPEKARKLSQQILDEAARDAADKPTLNEQANLRTAEKLLMLAHGLTSTDPATAIMFARQSFRYPATMYLAMFIYQLAKISQTAGDRVYEEALKAYRAAPMDQLLYLSAYPFGNNRDAGEMPGHTFYVIPEGFVVNPGLQRMLIQVLLERAQSAMAVTVETTSNRLSDLGQLWLAFTRLEKQIQTSLPDLADETTQAKDRLYALLNPATQTRVSNTVERDTQPKKTFDELVEAAEKLADVNRRDRDLTFAINGPSSRDVPLDRVLSVIDKISDSNLRTALVNWFYFFRTQSLIKDKDLDEARKTATKVLELDQRAYLFSRIAEESLKQSDDQTQAREMLNEIAVAAAKAPKTIVSARALLALAYLYAKVDVNRGIEELGNAVKTINSIESPDFSLQFVMMKLEGKTFGSYTSFATPGFNPENAFREMGKLDFDSSLSQAATFTDKSLRSLTTLAVIEPCLELAPNSKTKKTK